MIAGWRRFGSLPPGDRRLVCEAAALLVLAWIGLRLLRFATLRRVLAACAGANRPGDRPGQPSPGPTGRVAWAVTAAAARLPVSITCLVRALAADAMLRRRGYRPELRLGVRGPAGGSIAVEAHAWVECDGDIVIGEIDNLPQYAVMSAARHP